MLWPFSVFFGCKQSPFYLQPPDNTSLVHAESGLFVHRETELRVHAARLSSPPEGAGSGYVSGLYTQHFFRLGARSSNFNPFQFEQDGDYLVWKEVSPVGRDDFQGKTSLGAGVRWEKEGDVTVADVMEVFDYPIPEEKQVDQWTPWMKADRSREGIFAWHAEAHKKEAEVVATPPFPFEMRFRLVLSKRMYP